MTQFQLFIVGLGVVATAGVACLALTIALLKYLERRDFKRWERAQDERYGRSPK